MPELTILHGCRTIQLACGFNTLIDEADFLCLSQWSWQVHHHGRTNYVRRNRTITNKTDGTCRSLSIRLHREIIHAPKGLCVDHRNGDGLDNRRTNLRLATTPQNGYNRRSTYGRSRFKGVCLNKERTKWWACITANKRTINLGYHATEEQAARAYDVAARKYHGEFACTNADLFGAY